ncbi:MAG: cytidine deaminase [Bacteroidota bacterium]|nr:cytidine deaminase [Bacteroidota bacterium]
MNELSPDEQKLIEISKEAIKNSYSPYSNFKVGAAVLLDNGEIIRGSNQENAAYPSGLCAERVALFYANANYPENKVIAIAITAANDKGILQFPIAPCGSCRQVMLETEQRFNKSIRTFLMGNDKIYRIDSVEQLLPLHFNRNFLSL